MLSYLKIQSRWNLYSSYNNFRKKSDINILHKGFFFEELVIAVLNGLNRDTKEIPP